MTFFSDHVFSQLFKKIISRLGFSK